MMRRHRVEESKRPPPRRLVSAEKNSRRPPTSRTPLLVLVWVLGFCLVVLHRRGGGGGVVGPGVASAFLFLGAAAGSEEEEEEEEDTARSRQEAGERVLVRHPHHLLGADGDGDNGALPPTLQFAASHPCRADPTWAESDAFHEWCADELAWAPRSALWEGQLNRFEGMVLANCVKEEMHRHMERWKLTQNHEGGASKDVSGTIHNFNNNKKKTHTSPSLAAKLRDKASVVVEASALSGTEMPGEARVVHMYPPGVYPPLLVQIENAWSEPEVAAMNSTANCVRRYHPDTHFKNRYFAGAGGNNVTYMAGFLQLLAPGVVAHNANLVRMARAAAGWAHVPHPDPGTLGVRTNEHLLYVEGGEVGLHLDDESVYTIVVALSEPDQYGGGEYILYDSDDNTKKTLIKLPRRSALVFLSDYAEHGVAPLTGGRREMFAGEFWVEDDVPHTSMRPNIREFHEDVLGETYDEAQGDL